MPHFLAAFRTLNGIFLCNYHFAALIAVERGNAVSPPNLAGNAPVADIFKPVEINLIKSFGNKFCLAVFNRVNCRLCKLLHFNEPLSGYLRFNCGVTPLASTYVVDMLLGLDEISACFKVGNDSLSRLVSVHARIFGVISGNFRVAGHNGDYFQIVPLAYFKVVGIMGGSNFYNARTEIHFNVFVRNYGNLTSHQRQYKSLADNILVAAVVGIYRNGSIAQKRFGTGRSQFHVAATILERIADMPEVSRLLLENNLRVGQSRLAAGTPVYHSLAAVDKPFFVVLYKYVLDRF